MTTWSKTPPSEPGWYWCRYPSVVRVWQEPFAYLHMAGSSANDPRAEYGPRIPSPEAVSALEARLAAQEARIEAAKDALREAEDYMRAEGAFSFAERLRAALAKLEGR